EGKDDVRLVRAKHGIDRAPKGELCAFESAVIRGGLPLVPFGLREELQNIFDLRGQHGRSDFARKNPERGAVLRFLIGSEVLRRVLERRPGTNIAEIGRSSRAVRIVEI